MISEEVQKFASRIGVDICDFDREHPVSFRIDGDLMFSLEYRKSDQLQNEDLTVSVPLDCILSLRIPVAEYENQELLKFLKRSSHASVNLIPFSVGASRNYLLMMTDIPFDATSSDIENSILLLKRQYEEIISYGK
jgi:hypothetical protein